MTRVRIFSTLRILRPNHRGLTLPEILIASSLLILVLGVSGEMTIMAHRAFKQTSASAETFRAQTLAVDLMNRELRLCKKIISPGKTYGTVYNPGSPDEALVFERHSPSLNAETTVSYRLDPSARELIRESFEPGYDRLIPASQVLSASRSPKVMANKVKSFEFEAIDPDLHYGAFFVSFRITVQTGEGEATVGSQIRVRSL